MIASDKIIVTDVLNMSTVRVNGILIGGVGRTVDGWEIRKVGLASLMTVMVSQPSKEDAIRHLVDCAETLAQRILGIE